jgi:hypothetical protein
MRSEFLYIGLAQRSGTFGSAGFGTITGTTTDSRVMQLAIRITR